MTTLNHEIKYLLFYQVLPSSGYLSRARFFCKYEDTTELGKSLIRPILFPIVNVFYAVGYACRALWAAMRAIGNLFIIQPKAAFSAVQELGVHFSLTLAIVLMAPIHALSYSVELLTRLVSSWFIGRESTQDLSKLSVLERLGQEIVEPLLPSNNYLKQAKFFSKYEDVLGFLQAFFSPVESCISSVLYSCVYALKALGSAIDCVANVLICNPQHGFQRMIDTGIHASLAISFAVKAPINVIFYELAFLSRLGATWASAFVTNTEENIPENTAAIQV